MDQEAIECTKTSSMDREAVVKLSRQILKNFDGSKIYQEAIEIAIKKSQKGLINSLAIERCPAVVEIA